MSQSTARRAKVTYAEIGADRRTYSGTAYVEVKDLLVADLIAEANRLKEELSEHVESVSASLSGGNPVLTLNFRNVDSGGYSGSENYMPKGRREAVLEALAPACLRKVSASAEVVREDNGKHKQTRVTITLESGDVMSGLKAKRQLDGKDGVLRARVSSDARSITFTMVTPAANDDEGKITAVVDAVAGKIKAMVVRPIQVVEYDEDAALDPANDYVAPAAEVAADES